MWPFAEDDCHDRDAGEPEDVARSRERVRQEICDEIAAPKPNRGGPAEIARRAPSLSRDELGACLAGLLPAVEWSRRLGVPHEWVEARLNARFPDGHNLSPDHIDLLRERIRRLETAVEVLSALLLEVLKPAREQRRGWGQYPTP